MDEIWEPLYRQKLLGRMTSYRDTILRKTTGSWCYHRENNLVAIFSFSVATACKSAWAFGSCVAYICRSNGMVSSTHWMFFFARKLCLYSGREKHALATEHISAYMSITSSPGFLRFSLLPANSCELFCYDLTSM